jgi:hypothetical protein
MQKQYIQELEIGEVDEEDGCLATEVEIIEWKQE